MAESSLCDVSIQASQEGGDLEQTQVPTKPRGASVFHLMGDHLEFSFIYLLNLDRHQSVHRKELTAHRSSGLIKHHDGLTFN